MTLCNVRGVTRYDDPTENYCLNLQLPWALWRFIARSLFNCLAHSFTVLVVTAQLLSATPSRCFQQKSSKTPIVHYLLSIKREADTVGK